MFIERRDRKAMPSLNTSSLPDLIFTVLFFFMVVTHMRTVTVKVRYTLPQGKELTRLTKKGTVANIYIGRLPHAHQAPESTSGNPASYEALQINDKMATCQDITDYMAAERHRLAAEDRKKFSVSLKADKATKMQTINDVKAALRKAGVEKINYSATTPTRKSK